MKFEEKLVFLRKQKGLSQEELADVMDVSRQTVYKWESGSNMPDKAKLEKLTTFFHVSFDFLLDDKKDIPDPQAASSDQTPPTDDPSSNNDRPTNPHKTVFRAVFDSGVKNDSFDQARYEHGYAPDRDEKVKNSNDIFQANWRAMTQDLETAGYTNMVYPLAAAQCLCYFEDSRAKTFGFYFNGCEQFVCPFENLIDFRTTSASIGGTSLFQSNSKNPLLSTLSVNYFDQQGNPREYRLELTSGHPYVYFDNKNIKMAETYLKAIAMRLTGDLQKISSRLTGVKAAGALIQAGEAEVEAVDIESYQKRFAARSRQHAETNERIRKELADEKKAKKRARRIGCLVWIGVIVAVFILIYIVGSLNSCASAAVRVVHMSDIVNNFIPRI